MIKALAILNLILCLPVIGYCIVKITSDAARKWFFVWAAYTGALVASLLSGFQPLLLGEWPTIANVVGSAVIAVLVISTRFKQEG